MRRILRRYTDNAAADMALHAGNAATRNYCRGSESGSIRTKTQCLYRVDAVTQTTH